MGHVLITGASGFVGGWLAEFLLRQGYEVSALVRNPSAASHLQKQNVRLIQGDLSNPAALSEAVKDASTVFHVAGLVRALRKRELFDVNETGVKNVLSACAARTSPPKVVTVSSLAAAGPSRNDAWKTETDLPKPVSHYGQSKLAGEKVARSFADKLPISIVRPPIVFGPRDATFAEMIRPIVTLGIHPYPGAFSCRRYSIVHVNDLCRALWLVSERGERLTSDPSPETRGQGVYFAADHARFGYIELGKMIAQASGVRYMIPAPFFDAICWIGGGVNEVIGRVRGKPLVVNLDKVRESSAGSWTCSPEKMVRQFAWSPQKTAAEWMQETVDWCFSEGWFKPPKGYRRARTFPEVVHSGQLEPSR